MSKEEKELSNKVIYKGNVLELDEYEVQCSNGKKSKREVIHTHYAVCVVAKLDGKYILVEQYRFPFQKCLLEFPAGKANIGEPLVEAAYREFEEETGYRAGKMTLLGTMAPTPGICDEEITLFFAEDLVKTQCHFDEDEIIDIKYIPEEELIDLISKNVIMDAKTVFGYTMSKLHNF